ncbi:MAG: dicarboxylate/amino acid:cation symporter [Bacteroidota bacterium]
MAWYRKLHWQIILGLILGLIYGVIAAVNGWGGFVDAWVAPWGTIFLNGLKLIAVPLVLVSLILGVASLSDLRKLSRIGGKTIGIYLTTTAVAVTIGLIAVNIAEPGAGIPAETQQELAAAYAGDAEARMARAESAQERGPLQFLVDIVPENFFTSVSNNRNMLQVVFMALLIGIGLIQIPRAKAEPVLKVVEGLNEIVIRLVDVIMLLAPVGVFALLASAITEIAGDDPSLIFSIVGALAKYCGTVVVALFLHAAITYGTLLKTLSPMKIWTFLQGIGPAQLVAFSTSSSGATLPVTMERCEEKLGVSEEVSSFVLPLGATINMDGTALYQAVAAVFIAQAIGMDLSLAAQLTIVLTAVLASIGTAAVPGAGIIMLVIILEAVGVPAAGIALILGVDRILDMIRTVVNITGDATVATVVAASEGQLGEPNLSTEGDRLRVRAEV